jgi:hypothetical protein
MHVSVVASSVVSIVSIQATPRATRRTSGANAARAAEQKGGRGKGAQANDREVGHTRATRDNDSSLLSALPNRTPLFVVARCVCLLSSVLCARLFG